MTTSRSVCLAASMVCGLIAFADRAAYADSPMAEIAVMGIAAGDASLLSLSDTVTHDLEAAVRGLPGLGQLHPGSPHLLDALSELDCEMPPTPECEARIGVLTHVDRLLWGSLDRANGHVELALHFSADGARRVSSFELSAVDGERAAQIRSALIDVGTEYLRGTLSLQSDLTGEIFVDGNSVGKIVDGTAEVLVRPGVHQVVIRAPGGASATKAIEIGPSSSAVLTLNPEPKQESGSGLGPRMIGGIASLIIGGVASVVAVVATVKVGQDQAAIDPFRADPNVIVPGADACAPGVAGEYPNVQSHFRSTVIDACRDAKTFQIVEAVTWPIAGVFGALGVVLVALGDPPPVHVSAMISRDRALLQVQLNL
jgi:hypothetical protein